MSRFLKVVEEIPEEPTRYLVVDSNRNGNGNYEVMAQVEGAVSVLDSVANRIVAALNAQEGS